MKASRVVKGVLAVVLVVGLLFTVTAMAAESTFTGMVDEDAQGTFILSADDGEDYVITGSGLESMVGKTVKITGTLAEDAEPKTITIMSIEEVEE
ncbi:MAG: DUF5818 domain-containing protein [Desulfosarcinaceae bacterium]|jgi:hypothetical protein